MVIYQILVNTSIFVILIKNRGFDKNRYRSLNIVSGNEELEEKWLRGKKFMR